MDAALIRVPSADSDDDPLADLAELLTADDALRGLVRLVSRPPVAGQLGGGWDALAVGVGSGGAATALATGIALWLRNRWRTPRGTVTVDIELPDGTTVHIGADGTAEPEKVVEAALRPWAHDR
ncbi:MAG: hypothetical protein HOV71_21605 [Hamadaea sp.]|nr:hypothetical protein [Hamadaea sp.]NUT03749.1 hypothetical protein [Hamadaea sp.]